MALTFDIVADDDWFVGDDVTIPFVIYTDDDKGSRQDLTGFDLLYQLKHNPHDGILISKTEGDGITVTDALNGEGEIAISGDDTAGFAGGEYSHTMVRSNEPRATLFDGTVVIKKGSAP